MGTNTDKTPAHRKAEARAVVVMASARRQTYGTVDDELRLALDGFERACIDEAVAPALDFVQDLRNGERFPDNSDLDELRSLLTEGRE